MKRIIVYADFEFLTSTEEIGTLGYEHVRGKDHFVFEYSRKWLKQHGGILLSGDLRSAIEHLSAIVGGTITPDETLGNIFSHFCVGK